MIRRLGVLALFAGGACLPWLGAADDNAGGMLSFTPAEIRAILKHGPWPMQWSPDPSNRVSGKREAAELGELLFFETRLSGTGKVACVSCHMPDRGWTDGLKRGVALAEVDRNTPPIMNVRYSRWFGWDGGSDSLWAQSIKPIVDARELGASPQHAATLIRADADLSCRYRKAFGQPPSATDDEAVLADLAKALAAFAETQTSNRTPFDDFRDALARGDEQAASQYPEPVRRGLKIFIGKGGCNTCHMGPNFTSGEFHNVGIHYFKAGGGVDSGRYDGIRNLLASRFNLLGPYNDDRARSTATPTRHVELTQRNFGEFRVPSLREVAFSGPYMHNGEIPTLREVMRYYSELNEERLHQDGERILRPLKLSAQETDDLIAFVESLTSLRRPTWVGKPDLPPCK